LKGTKGSIRAEISFGQVEIAKTYISAIKKKILK